MSTLENLERLLALGKDGALLRYGLGNEYLKAGRAAEAVAQLRAALALDPNYSAAWKLLGRALTASGEYATALATYTEGIAVAEKKGDVQAAKEMKVFAQRIAKQRADG